MKSPTKILRNLAVNVNEIEDLTPLKDLPGLIFFDGSNNRVKRNRENEDIDYKMSRRNYNCC